MLVKEILQTLWALAPEHYKEGWDNVGLLCGHGDRDVRRVLVALDPTPAVAEEAVRRDCQLVLTHHPLIHGGLMAAVDDDPMGAAVLAYAERGLAVISMHTNLDCAPGGVNDVLAERLGLRDVTVFDDGETAGLVRIGVLAGETDCHTSAAALARNDRKGETDCHTSAAALARNDRKGETDCHTSAAALARNDRTEETDCHTSAAALARNDRKGETDCHTSAAALARNDRTVETDCHTSAAALFRNDRTGETDCHTSAAALARNDKNGVTAADFAAYVKAALHCEGLRWVDGGRPIRRVAVGGGSCADYAPKVLAAGCDALVTADVKYHQFCDAARQGLTLIDAGHFQTENPVCERLLVFLRERLPDVEAVRSEVHADCIRFI